MEGSAQESVGTQSSWLRCYRCWSQNLEVQLHYEGILKVDADTGEAVEPVEEVQEAVVQCLDCLHDQPHLALTFYDEDGRRISRIEPVEDRWERMVTGTPWVASCTVSVDADQVESCSGPEAAESLAFAAFGDHGTREFFTHVRFHKHEEDRIVIHMLVELYARSADEATEVMEQAARGSLTITSLAEESRPPASSGDDTHWRPAKGLADDAALRGSAAISSPVCGPARAAPPPCARPGAAAATAAGSVGPQIGEATRSSAPAVGWSTLSVAGRPAAAAAASASGTVRTLPTGTPAPSSASTHSSARRSRRRAWSSGISSRRFSTRAALVAKRASPAQLLEPERRGRARGTGRRWPRPPRSGRRRSRSPGTGTMFGWAFPWRSGSAR